MTDSPKKLSQKLMRKNRLSSTPSLKTLEELIQGNGFTIIEYNKYNNTPEVNELIQTLRIEDRISTENSFVYVDGNIEFVFINSDLKLSEKTTLLCHELGHICDTRLDAPNHIYSRIERESFANEFAHYLEHPTVLTRIISTFLKRKLVFILIFALSLLTATGIYIVSNSQATSVFSAHEPTSLTQSYYVTTTGIRYHKDFCKHVKYKTNTTQMTIDDAISQGYTPCLDCIGE
ncbi:MAG: ImmA/IrrE family metallo-endopeptidase [Clostridia bacterium]|nr:ImmA/IrrE family metallo-endopeptidase [Clostridia bacterium]